MAVHGRVIGGRHDGASFQPGNGIAAQTKVETQIVDSARMRREMAQGFAMIERRRKKKWGIR